MSIPPDRPIPAWAATVYEVLANASKANWRINHFRLTEQEARELPDFTGSKRPLLLGHPVEIKHPSP
jgi:hypothetical protein